MADPKDMRAPMRAEPNRVDAKADDPRERAAKRAAEIASHGSSLDDGVDKFFFDRRIIPDGWDYEWKMWAVNGAEDPSHQMTLARGGWEPVPADRDEDHRAMMPSGYTGKRIMRDGLILMERPLEITQRARARELQLARAQVRAKETGLTDNPKITLGEPTKPTVRHNYEPIQIPE